MDEALDFKLKENIILFPFVWHYFPHSYSSDSITIPYNKRHDIKNENELLVNLKLIEVSLCVLSTVESLRCIYIISCCVTIHNSTISRCRAKVTLFSLDALQTKLKLESFKKYENPFHSSFSNPLKIGCSIFSSLCTWFFFCFRIFILNFDLPLFFAFPFLFSCCLNPIISN